MNDPKGSAQKGIYTEYLDRAMSMPELVEERQKQLKRVAEARGRNVLAYAADLKPGDAPTSISYEDLLPLKDQIHVLGDDAVDVIVETPGGSAEVVEDIVTLLRDNFGSVAFIIPGWAKSAGTIMAMSGDEILMEPASALGPIDAQIIWKGKVFSAEAFLEGLESMKEETDKRGDLNRAHIPILQQISPGEIQHARNGLSFAQRLVTEWLRKYKFANWITHASSGEPVTPQEREERAREIAQQLCSHKRWLSHGRSIKMSHLEELGLKVTDYSADPELYDALTRYHTLMQMTFGTNIYKLFETPTSQIVRWRNPTPSGGGPIPAAAPPKLKDLPSVDVDVKCPQCRKPIPLQLPFEKGVPVQKDKIRYPKSDLLACPHCGSEVNLAAMRQQIEQQAGRPVVRDS